MAQDMEDAFDVGVSGARRQGYRYSFDARQDHGIKALDVRTHLAKDEETEKAEAV